MSKQDKKDAIVFDLSPESSSYTHCLHKKKENLYFKYKTRLWIESDILRVFFFNRFILKNPKSQCDKKEGGIINEENK